MVASIFVVAGTGCTLFNTEFDPPRRVADGDTGDAEEASTDAGTGEGSTESGSTGSTESGSTGSTESGSTESESSESDVDTDTDTEAVTESESLGESDVDTGVDECEPIARVEPVPFELLAVAEASGENVPDLVYGEPGCVVATFCHGAGTCHYDSDGYLGQLISGTPGFMGGVSFESPDILQIHLANACGATLLTEPTEYLGVVALDSSQNLLQAKIYLPCFEGAAMNLFVTQEGSTYWDAGLTDLAAAAP
ncbi:hypothetical protein PPSIR1_35732 [Plesiocystis pacifica SIR-1]|uniref:Uncharacterized protein n=1 Tax=Plesiocystis pacifica SIR-1 TaxID=391625 RepID=A6G1S5_9BACT|nr:hypothetical protein PPSIR1_35732 [Plesiocystis pacifica SIR-1]